MHGRAARRTCRCLLVVVAAALLFSTAAAAASAPHQKTRALLQHALQAQQQPRDDDALNATAAEIARTAGAQGQPRCFKEPGCPPPAASASPVDAFLAQQCGGAGSCKEVADSGRCRAAYM